MKLVLNEQQLTRYCDGICKEIWGEKMEIPITINGRLTKTLGSFYYSKDGKKALQIAIAKKILIKNHYKMETILSVIKHELCHYHLFRNNKEFDDGTYEFNKECEKIKASLTGTIKPSGIIMVGYCKHCGKKVIRNAKPRHYNNPNKFTTKCCGAKIRYEQTFVEDQSINEFIDYDIEFIKRLQNDNKVNNRVIDSKHPEGILLKIESIVVPGKRGVTRTQVRPAVEHCVDEKSPEKLQMIKKYYPEYFRQVCMYISKKRLKYIEEIGLA